MMWKRSWGECGVSASARGVLGGGERGHTHVLLFAAVAATIASLGAALRAADDAKLSEAIERVRLLDECAMVGVSGLE